ncbi:MAG: nuclear transport factor 2 family protein [Acidobacteria bacterium]|nr:nuclear transport factor 2 family protein [Acidobacteriota bacterium]
MVLAAIAVANAQQGDANASTLTALDYYEIEQLNARYCHGLDSARDNGYMFADVFTPNGIYVDASGNTYEGREQLAAFARQDPDSIKGPTNVRHYVTNTMVEVAPGGASAKGYLMVARPSTGGGGATDGGQYWDDLVKTEDGWRIARRSFIRTNGRPAARTLTSLPAAATAGLRPRSSERAEGPQLTAQDYADIQQLYARYGFAWDGILDEGRMWISLFTPDGVHINETGGQFFQGRDALLGFALQRKEKDNRVPERVNHFITNMLLEATSEGVTARPYLLRVNIRREGEPGSTITAGGI